MLFIYLDCWSELLRIANISYCHCCHIYIIFYSICPLNTVLTLYCTTVCNSITSPLKYLLCAPHLGWPWCCICECSESTRSLLGSLHHLLHLYVRPQSRSPTAWTQPRAPSCPAPVGTVHTQTRLSNSVHIRFQWIKREYIKTPKQHSWFYCMIHDAIETTGCGVLKIDVLRHQSER